MLTQRRCSLLALSRLALEGVVNRFAESVPEFLLLLALDRHALRLMLPALLQVFDGVNVQLRLCAQHLRLFNHGFAVRQTLGTCSPERRIGNLHGGLPHRLNFSKGLFTKVSGCSPFFNKAVEAADVMLPVGVALVRLGPGQHFINQLATLGLDGFGLLLDFLQPGFNHLVRFVAGVIKPLPQRVVGRATLVACFPLLAHGAQRVLLLAPAHGLGNQGLGFGHQLFTDLVCTPALPAFQLASGGQGRMCGCFQRMVNIANVFFQGLTQIRRRLGGGFAMAFAHGLLQIGQRGFYSGGGFGTHFLHHGRIQLDLGRTRGLVACSRIAGMRRAAGTAQLVSPDRHGRQRRSGVFGSRNGQSERSLKSLPYGQQLATRGIQQRGKFRVHAGPVAVLRQLVGLGLPMCHICAQRVPRSLRIAPGFGRQHLHALCHQNSGLALHLHAVLQVFNGFHAVSQLGLQPGQRLTGQRGTGFGGVTLPGQGVGQVELFQRQQCVAFFSPFSCHGLLAFETLGFVQLFLEWLGCALVAVGQVFIDLCHLLGRRLGGQPLANARRPLARGRRRKSAARQAVQWVGIRLFGSRCFHGRGFGLGRFGHEGTQHIGKSGKKAGLSREIGTFRLRLDVDQHQPQRQDR